MELPARERDAYIAWRPEFPEPRLEAGNTALLIIDMQYLDAHPDYGMLRSVRAAGFEEEFRQLAERLEKVIVPNLRLLQDEFRSAGLEVIHTKIQSMTSDGRDRGRSHKKLGMAAPPGSKEGEILEELAPLANELVFSKTAGSVFQSTNVEYVLRNMDVRTLVIGGVVTTGCVHTAVSDAADRGFNVILVEDGCGAIVHDMHVASIRTLRDVYCKVMTARDVVDRVRALRGLALSRS